MNNFLNYQGNKNRLISFIDSYLPNYFQQDKKFLDIFSGGASVSNHYFNNVPMISNDIEIYSYHLANAIYSQGKRKFDDTWKSKFITDYKMNFSQLQKLYTKELKEEQSFISSKEFNGLKVLYDSIPTIWNNHFSKITNKELLWTDLCNVSLYCLMTTHYSTSYFGLLQSIELDSLKYAIDNASSEYNISFLYSALYGVMAQTVFSKDGHMAQPLSFEKNINRLFKCRSIKIYESFFKTIDEYIPQEPCFENIAMNHKLSDFFSNEELLNNVGCIYADPPYTDMQYSRYYHLLTTITKYEYCEPTIKYGKYTSGLYLNNRLQSPLSTRTNCLPELRKLMNICALRQINFCISFAYPDEISSEKNDRYTMDIKELISACKEIFSEKNVTVQKLPYEHANHRNSSKKKVYEYLICCRGV